MEGVWVTGRSLPIWGGGVVGLQGREDNRDRRLYHNLQEGEVAVSGFEKAHSGTLGGLVH